MSHKSAATLAAIKAMPVRGNSHHDQPILLKLHVLAMDNTAPDDVRLQTLDYINTVLGTDGPKATQKDLAEYVQYAIGEGRTDGPKWMQPEGTA